MLTDEEIKQILEAIQEAYRKVGKEITHAVEVAEIKENGEIEGKVLIDNTEKQ
jgi:hypothetical protein